MKKKLLIIIAVVIIVAIGVTAGVIIATRVPAQIKDTGKMLEDTGYIVEVLCSKDDNRSSEELFGIGEGTFQGQIKAVKPNGDFAYIYFCENENASKKVYERLEELYNSATPESVEDYVYSRNGNIVYFGSSKGVKAAK